MPATRLLSPGYRDTLTGDRYYAKHNPVAQESAMTETSGTNVVPTTADSSQSLQYREIRDRLEEWLNNNLDDFKRALSDLVREGKVSREALKGNKENSTPPAPTPSSTRSRSKPGRISRRDPITAFGITHDLDGWAHASGMSTSVAAHKT